MKLKIEYAKTEDLKPYANNAKIHSEEQIEQIKKSIQDFGMNDPIAVWKDNEIIEGHGRLIACIDLGIETVPIIRLDNLTDEQRRAYMLVHNQLTMNTGYDQELLAMELEKLENVDMAAFGFDDGAVEEEKYQEQEESLNEQEKVPDSRIIVAAVSLFGDDNETIAVKNLDPELSGALLKKVEEASPEVLTETVYEALQEAAK